MREPEKAWADFGPKSAQEHKEFHQAVQEGIDSADRGELIPHEEVRALIESWLQQNDLGK